VFCATQCFSSGQQLKFGSVVNKPKPDLYEFFASNFVPFFSGFLCRLQWYMVMGFYQTPQRSIVWCPGGQH
jgi:hypothetical protein